jgi:hypothetical protein
MRSSRPPEELAEAEDEDEECILKVDRKSVKKKGKLNTSVSCPVLPPLPQPSRSDTSEQLNNSLKLIQDALVDDLADEAVISQTQTDSNSNSSPSFN